MTAPEVVKELVERFDAHKETYQSSQYNEAQLREEFLNPLFEALGWDLYNRKGYADAYKEVIHEDAIKIGGRTKAPDYCFRAGGGQRSFFVEAKKPSVDIGEAISPAYQLRRYAWSAKLPVSILTDFEEFAVYDCRIRPDKDDKASTARAIFLNYTEYIERWDELYRLFSPDAIRKGSLEKFVTSKRVKKGTAEVDKAFLEEIEGWRTDLAQHLALRNKGLEQRDLNFAVQRIIDRIIFLRICEDRGIEKYGTLEALQNAPNIYRRMRELFQMADDRYNSGLFHFTQEKDRSEPPDELTLDLTVEDKPLKEILGGLYFPESPYEFSVFPAEILGQVYEQFLGKVIRLTKGHQAKIEEKPEVRKAGGVYYTPSYIVDYIVRHTVGKLLNGESEETLEPDASARSKSKAKITPTQAAKLRILDPACGSGSFLLGAYQYLLDWHRDWYVADGEEKHAKGRSPKLYRGSAGDWRLTSAERKRILLNNIYGVDIDEQAVEVTKLSLLLKVLEGESAQTIDNQLRFLHERALPDLGDNIKCGNSLIGPDFYNGNQLKLFDDDEKLRVNAFDWHDKKLGFGKIMSSGGFDAVIGNPPYGASADEKQIDYYRKHYESSIGSCDSFALFVEQASRLLQAEGIFGMIIQSAFVSSPSMSNLRDLFIAKFRPLSIASLPYDVFSAYIDTTIVTAQKLHKNQSLRDFTTSPVSLYVFPPRFKIESVDDFNAFAKTADASQWVRENHNEFVVTLSESEHTIIDRLNSISSKFSHISDIQRGVTPFNTSKTKPKRNPAKAFKGTVRRYKIIASKRFYIQYDKTLAEYKPPRYFRGPRILLREMISRQFRLQAVFVKDNYITNKSMQSILPSDDHYNILYLLGLLNSRLLSWYFLSIHSVGRRDDFPKIVLKQTRDLPFRVIDFSDKSDKRRHDRMVSLVETMLELHKKVAEMKAGHEKTVVERQISATDRQIDQLVYELYGLTDEEIAIVEGTAN
jgi:predicted type IV restriction endonuclease